jgi:hypothetical protein
VWLLEEHHGHGRQPLDLAVNDHRVQAFLAAEVLVHHGLGNAGLSGDLLDRGALESPLSEQPPPDVEKLLPPFLASHSLSGNFRGLVGHRNIMAAMPPPCQPALPA